MDVRKIEFFYGSTLSPSFIGTRGRWEGGGWLCKHVCFLCTGGEWSLGCGMVCSCSCCCWSNFVLRKLLGVQIRIFSPIKTVYLAQCVWTEFALVLQHVKRRRRRRDEEEERTPKMSLVGGEFTKLEESSSHLRERRGRENSFQGHPTIPSVLYPSRPLPLCVQLIMSSDMGDL